MQALCMHPLLSWRVTCCTWPYTLQNVEPYVRQHRQDVLVCSVGVYTEVRTKHPKQDVVVYIVAVHSTQQKVAGLGTHIRKLTATAIDLLILDWAKPEVNQQSG